MTDTAKPGSVRTESDGRVLRIVVDNVAKRNAFTPDMMASLSDAFTAFDRNDEQWVAVLCFAIVDLARLLREFAADVVGVLLDVFAQARHELAHFFGFHVVYSRLLGARHARRHDCLFDLAGIANRTAQFAALRLQVECCGVAEPALELMGIAAAEIVDDHGRVL